MRLLFYFLLGLSPSSGFAQYAMIPLKMLSNEVVYLSSNKHTTVVVFFSPECPLCQNYTLTLNEIQAKYKDKVDVIAIFPGTEYSLESIKTFKMKYHILFSLWKDEKMELVKALSAKVTPEVFLFDASGKIRYQGRIDNWAYEVGRKRKVITQHDLRDALVSVLNHQEIKVKQTKAIGCFIE